MTQDIQELRTQRRLDLIRRAGLLPDPYAFYQKGWFTGILNALHEISPCCEGTVKKIEYWYNEGLKGLKFEQELQELSLSSKTMPENFPEIGSVWLNNHRQKNYTVHGVVAHCEGGDNWEILYRSDDMPKG